MFKKILHIIFGHPQEKIEYIPEAGGFACLGCKEGLPGIPKGSKLWEKEL